MNKEIGSKQDLNNRVSWNWKIVISKRFKVFLVVFMYFNASYSWLIDWEVNLLCRNRSSWLNFGLSERTRVSCNFLLHSCLRSILLWGWSLKIWLSSNRVSLCGCSSNAGCLINLLNSLCRRRWLFLRSLNFSFKEFASSNLCWSWLWSWWSGNRLFWLGLSLL